MANNIKKPETKLPAATNLEVNVGPKGTYIENVNNLNLTEKNYNITTTVNGNTVTSNLQPNNDYYNLFVLDSEEFAKGYFIIKTSEALMFADKEIAKNYSKDNKESLDACTDYPCLFANKNKSYKHGSESQLAYFGYLTKIDETKEGYKFFFSIVCSLPQQLFNDNCTAFGMFNSLGENELDRIHWSIKKKNLIKSIRALGYNVCAY